MSSAAIASASATSAASIASGAAPPSAAKRRAIRSSAAKRLTAVGRVAASRRRAVSKRSAGGVEAPLRIEKAAPYAAATPIAGAPRTAMSRIATAISGARSSSSQTLVAGQQPLVEQPQDAPLAVEGAEDLRGAHGAGRRTRPAPCRRGSATASVLPPGSAATACTRPIFPETGSRAESFVAWPIASSAMIHAGSKRVRLELDDVGQVLLVEARRGDGGRERLGPQDESEEDLEVRRR